MKTRMTSVAWALGCGLGLAAALMLSARWAALAQASGSFEEAGPPDSLRQMEIEPNGFFTEAHGLPAPGPAEVTGNITPTGDVDWYALAATAGDLLFAAVRTGESPPGQQDGQLRVYDPSGAVLLEFDDDDGDDGGLGANLASVVAGLPITNWIRFFVWLLIGLVIYFCYSRRRSTLRRESAEATR